jgi:hypothetical protein
MAKINFSQTVTGQDRKTIASVIGQALGDTPKYAGPPTFGYTAGGWMVDKSSLVTSPEMDMTGIAAVKNVITALNITGLNAEGSLRINIYEISEDEVKVLCSVIASKSRLLKKSLKAEAPLVVIYENGSASMPFFPASLDGDRVIAFLTLALKLAEFAGTLKYSSAKDKPVDNEKYALRCFLLRLGFIGDKFKAVRKVLLSPMEGNTAHRRIPAIGEMNTNVSIAADA